MSRTAILYIAERCNQQCVFCLEEDGSWNEFVDPSTQQVFDVLGELRDRGAEQITFMGGETFFRKDLPQIISDAEGRGYRRIGVTTNGTVLSKKGFIQRLMDSGLDFIELSVHGHTEELANAISRSKVTFDRQARAMAEIDATGSLFTIVNVVVCPENKDHLADVAKYVQDSLPSVPVRFKLKFVSLQGWEAERAHDEGGALSYGDVDFVALGDSLEAEGIDFWIHNVPLCRLGRHAARSHELSVMSADERYFDLDHRGPDEYYDSGHQLEGHVWPAGACGQCTLRPVCPGIEESHRRIHGVPALSPRSDDPVALVRVALEQRGKDPDEAERRLEVLQRAPRPERFIQNRPEGALRFVHPEEDEPFDLVVAPRKANDKAFHVTERFALSYRPRTDADCDPRSRVMGLLEAARDALTRADAEGLELDRVHHCVFEAAPPPWRRDPSTVPAPTRRKKGELPVLKGRPPPTRVNAD